jgi:predicted DNA-binding transcriptional regulator AlpA
MLLNPRQRREPHRLIRKREVLAKTGDSQSTWYLLIQQGCVAWYEPDIDDLIDARLQGGDWRDVISARAAERNDSWQQLGDVAARVTQKVSGSQQ